MRHVCITSNCRIPFMILIIHVYRMDDCINKFYIKLVKHNDAVYMTLMGKQQATYVYTNVHNLEVIFL